MSIESDLQRVISVIVPVYNSEQYIHQCVDSILNQTFKDFELILVDDGSIDNSGIICDEYAKKNARIVVIHQKNQGVSAARNTGLKCSQGKYVAFIDSDDYILENYLEELYKIIELEQAEIAMCKRFHFTDGEDPNPQKLNQKRNVKFNVMTGKQAIELRYEGDFCIAPGEKLIAKRLFEQIYFPEGRACEDQAVIPFVIYRSKKICITEEELYYYRIRKTSLSHGQFSEKMFDNIIFMNQFIKFLNSDGEKRIANKAKKLRDETLALYTIMALKDGIDIPKRCRMNEVRAYLILRKIYSEDKYSWFLSLLHPRCVQIHEYVRKIESIFGRKHDKNSKNR